MGLEENVKLYNFIRDPKKVYNENDMSLYKSEYNYVSNELSIGNCISQAQYKFICWLNFNDSQQFPTIVNKPHIPEIIEMSASDFFDTFCLNTTRINLFGKLNEFLKFKNCIFNCQYLDLLIGGSYIDIANVLPTDIDFAVLLEKDIISRFSSACDILGNTDRELDVDFLDSEISYTHYSTYVWVTMLGNLAEIRDKENADCIKNNTFEKRKVYKVRFHMSAEII